MREDPLLEGERLCSEAREPDAGEHDDRRRHREIEEVPQRRDHEDRDERAEHREHQGEPPSDERSSETSQDHETHAHEDDCRGGAGLLERDALLDAREARIR